MASSRPYSCSAGGSAPSAAQAAGLAFRVITCRLREAGLALVELSVIEPCISPVTGPGIQHGKDHFRALLGCGNRGVDIHVVRPERVHHGVLTAHRADDTVAAV